MTGKRRWLTAVPLRSSAPVAVLAFALLAGAWTYFSNVRIAERQVEDDAQGSLRLEAEMLQQSLDYLYAIGAIEQLQKVLSAKRADAQVQVAVVADERGVVVAAGSRPHIGRTIPALLEELRAHAPKFDADAAARRARELHAGVVALSPGAELALAMYPISRGMHGADATAPAGVLVLARELTSAKARARALVARNVILLAAPFALFAAALFLLVHFAVTRRARVLTDAVSAFAGGDLQARAQLRGGDEIAAVGLAFDSMAEQLCASQRELRDSAQRIEGILDSAMDGVITVDEAHRITLFNRAAERIFQRTAQEMRGRPLDELLPPRFRAAHGAHIRNFGKTGATRRTMGALGTIHGLRANGEEFPMEASISLAAFGRQRLFTVILRDITERVQADAARGRLEEQLRQAQKMEAIGTLVGGIAHDFNNVLGAVLGNAQLAHEDTDREHPARRSIEEICRAAQRGKDVVRRLLAFSRPQTPERRALEPRPLVEEVIGLLRSILPAGVALRLTVETDPPTIAADASQLHQVLLNLVTNAWHAMEGRPGSIEFLLAGCRVESTLSHAHPELSPGPYARISVRDNGKGMDQATLARIFDPFFTTKPAGEGTGLGLSVVHGIVRSHGGAVLVDSEPGNGSTFHLYFPATQAQVEGDAAQTPSASARGSGQHVLYIDDEEPLVFLAERFLSRLGYRVTSYTQAKEALAAFRSDPYSFDVVVTDFNMPTISGLELARELLAIRRDTPIVLASGYLRAGDIAQARELGVTEVILKPDTVDGLAPVIARLVGRDDEPRTRG